MRIVAGRACVAVSLLGLLAVGTLAGEVETLERKIQAAWDQHKSFTCRHTMWSHRVEGEVTMSGEGEGAVAVLRKGATVLYRIDMKTSFTRSTEADEITMSLTANIIIDDEREYLVQDFDGPVRYVIVPINPRVVPSPMAVFEVLRENSDLKVLPEETVADQPAYVVEATRRSVGSDHTTKIIAYFAKDTGVLLKQVNFGIDGAPIERREYLDHKFNVDLDPQRFVFSPPPDVDVLDFTKKRRAAEPESSPPGEAKPQPQPAP
jgi:outer membrane lipoprotein-sorting protein